MVIDQARTRIDDLDRPQQITVMLGAVCHDLGKPSTTAFIDGRIRSIDHEQAGVAPATRAARSAQRAHDRRLRRRAPGSGIVAHHLKPGAFFKSRDAGRRRRVPPSRAEGRPRAARARRARRTASGGPAAFDCSANGLVPGARARSASSTRRPTPIVKGRHILALGVPPGRASGRCCARFTNSSSMGASDARRRAVAGAGDNRRYGTGSTGITPSNLVGLVEASR